MGDVSLKINDPYFLHLAKVVCIVAHEALGQKRERTNEPYYVHPFEVAEIVGGVTDDVETIAAAYCHDVIEDTGITREVLASLLTPRVADWVAQVSDFSKPEDGNRGARKAIDRAHYANASPEGKTIKLADIISNLGTINDLESGFARVYIDEIKALLPLLRGGDRRLFYRALEMAATCRVGKED